MRQKAHHWGSSLAEAPYNSLMLAALCASSLAVTASDDAAGADDWRRDTRKNLAQRADWNWPEDDAAANEYLRPYGHRLSGDQSGFKSFFRTTSDALTGITRAGGATFESCLTDKPRQSSPEITG